MPNIFISYRRSDTKSHAFELYKSLVAKYPDDNVFMDQNEITPGLPWPPQIMQSLAKSDCVLALIGPEWTTGGKLNDQNDWVRMEIEMAFAQGRPVIPVIVDQGRIPSAEELPESLRQLARRKALSLELGHKTQVEQIESWIEKTCSGEHRAKPISHGESLDDSDKGGAPPPEKTKPKLSKKTIQNPDDIEVADENGTLLERSPLTTVVQCSLVISLMVGIGTGAYIVFRTLFAVTVSWVILGATMWTARQIGEFLLARRLAKHIQNDQ